MKSKIEAVANVIVIAFAVVVGSVFLKDRLSPVAPESNVVKAGDKLANVAGWDWSTHDQTLVLGLRNPKKNRQVKAFLRITIFSCAAND